MSHREKVIAHVDMDAFFAAVEQHDQPSLKGRPVVVGADPKKGRGRGVVSTCSYEARQYGIHSAMAISTAYQRCPQAVFLPVRMDRYAQASQQIFDILSRFTPDIEPLSIDEAFLDITETCHLYGTPLATGQKIREQIRDETGLTASVGLGSVKMVAKIASDVCKPDGLLEIKKEKTLEFLWPLDVDKLWGVGPKTKALLNQQGVATIGDLARIPLETLVYKLGQSGALLFDLAHGIDERGVKSFEEAKSVSQEHTFEHDQSDKKTIEGRLLLLSEKVSRRLRQEGLKGRTITLKIRSAGFLTCTRSTTLGEATNFVDDIYHQVKKLFDSIFSSVHCVRLVGVKVSNFKNMYVQECLFDQPQSEKKEQLHQAVDRIKDKYGERAIQRAR